jgi:hypothetical protein
MISMPKPGVATTPMELTPSEIQMIRLFKRLPPDERITLTEYAKVRVERRTNERPTFQLIAGGLQ